MPDAISQAELVRRREVQPEELIVAAIEGIERLNLRLNAVVTPLFYQAWEQAAALPVWLWEDGLGSPQSAALKPYWARREAAKDAREDERT